MSRERIPAIIGLGEAVGRIVIDNQQMDEMMGRKLGTVDRMMKSLGVGIRTRYWVKPGEQTASTLSAEALQQALLMAMIEGASLKSMIVGSSSQDHLGVPIAPMVQHRLGLPTNMRLYDVYAACTGWLQALQNSYADLESEVGSGGPQAVIGTEIISPMINSKKPETFLLFGDASGATVVDLVEPDEGIPTPMAFYFGGDGKYVEDLYVPAGGSRNPTTAETVADPKYLHVLHMNGRVVKEQATRRMSESIRAVLNKTELPIEEIGLFIPHQANLQIMRETADAVGLPQDKVVVTIDRYGNTSAASIPTAMSQAYEQGKLRRNQLLLVSTFGAGLTYGAALIPMVGLPPNNK